MFHRPSFSTVSFSPVSFHGAMTPVVQDGKSGYWRLFFTQMQEEALRQYEEKTGKKTVKNEVAVAKKPVKKPRTIHRTREEVPDTSPVVPFKLKPIYKEPEAVDYVWLMSMQIQTEILKFQPHLMWARLEQVKIKQAAANDEDMRRRLLLLLAA